jgi:hypothetical protein
MVKVIDKNGTQRTFQEAEGFQVGGEGVLMLVRSAASAATTSNLLAVFAPGAWQWATTTDERVAEQGTTRTT